MEEEIEWYIFVEGNYEDKGFFANFYCISEGIGDSIELIKPLAKKEGFKNLQFIEATRIDNIENFEYPGTVIDLSPTVKMMQSLSLFEKDPNEYSFTPPTGIIFNTLEGEHDMDKIKEQFVAYDKNENEIYKFELVIDANNLEHVFYLATKFLDSIDGFWIWLHAHWEEKPKQLYFNKHFVSVETVVDFCKTNSKNIIENGFIDIVVHSIKGETNLTLNEHKKLSLHTKDEKVFNDFIDKIMGLGYKQTRDMYDIEFGYHHWHYKPANTFSRNEFCKFLVENSFGEMKIAI